MAVDLSQLGDDDNDTDTQEYQGDGTYYVWTPIRKGDGKTIPVGTQVTASDLGIDEEEFEEYLDSGAVRPVQYPVHESEVGSLAPATHYKREAARMSGNLDQSV